MHQLDSIIIPNRNREPKIPPNLGGHPLTSIVLNDALLLKVGFGSEDQPRVAKIGKEAVER
jgi:hypothetical protein